MIIVRHELIIKIIQMSSFYAVDACLARYKSAVLNHRPAELNANLCVFVCFCVGLKKLLFVFLVRRKQMVIIGL